MPRILLGIALAALGAAGIAGCDPKPSTPIAPDVKEPDLRKATGEDLLKRKMAGDSAGTSAANAANTAPQ